jgi:purine-binding chemotaxis protein CheW
MSAQAVQEKSTYLTFGLGEETFAMDVSNVREVLDVIDVTKVPRTPDYMLGVINLRGGVVPVVDMRIKFGLPATEESVDTCIIVTEVDLDGESTIIGALADSVQEVFEMAADEIEPPPSLGMRLNAEFVKGMGKRDDRFIIILDVNRIFSTEELIEFQGTDEEVQSAEAVEGEDAAQ